MIGAANGAAALQKIALAPVVVIAEGYATAATIAKQGAETRIFASLPMIDQERFIREKGPSNYLQQALSKWKSRLPLRGFGEILSKVVYLERRILVKIIGTAG